MVSHPVQDNQHCLQTLSNVPGNSQLSQVENNSSLLWSCVSQAGLGLCVIQAGLKFIAILLPLLLEHRVYKSEPQHPAFVLGQVPEVRTWVSPAHGLWQNLHGKERAWMSMNWRFTPLFWWGKKIEFQGESRKGKIEKGRGRNGEKEEQGEEEVAPRSQWHPLCPCRTGDSAAGVRRTPKPSEELQMTSPLFEPENSHCFCICAL